MRPSKQASRQQRTPVAGRQHACAHLERGGCSRKVRRPRDSRLASQNTLMQPDCERVFAWRPRRGETTRPSVRPGQAPLRIAPWHIQPQPCSIPTPQALGAVEASCSVPGPVRHRPSITASAIRATCRRPSSSSTSAHRSRHALHGYGCDSAASRDDHGDGDGVGFAVTSCPSAQSPPGCPPKASAVGHHSRPDDAMAQWLPESRRLRQCCSGPRGLLYSKPTQFSNGEPCFLLVRSLPKHSRPVLHRGAQVARSPWLSKRLCTRAT